MPLNSPFANDLVCCAHCQGDTWKAYLDEDDEGSVHFLICCDNEACAETQRLRLGGKENQLIVSFDFVVGTNSELENETQEAPDKPN